MKRAELVARLVHNVTQAKHRWRGQGVIARFLLQWFRDLPTLPSENYDFWEIDGSLLGLVLDATDELRTDEKYAAFRADYEDELGRSFPNLREVGSSDIIEKNLAGQIIGFLLKDVTGLDWVERDFLSRVRAEEATVCSTFDRFLGQVHRRGLFDCIAACDARGMSGQFGRTELLSFVCAGRCMFTFRRDTGDVSFVLQEEDFWGYTAGLQSAHASLIECVDMINEVIKLWPSGKTEQAATFKADKAIGLG